ncbi:MAG TPA: FixH family protein [Burkholderiales bacterium]|nr:FixH family protein [Burkholderiales bacterium]
MRSLAALLIIFFSGTAIAQKLDGKLDCKYAGTDFIYDCTITLQRGGQPLSGAQVTVGADMPSMPMAHNIKPIKAAPTGTPGEYRARLDLEMTGEWAVKLRIAGPVREQLVLHYVFTESGTAPRK